MFVRRLLTLLKPILIGAASGGLVLAIIIGGLSWAKGKTAGTVAKPTTSASASESPSASASPTANADTCSVAKFAKAKELGKLQAMVVDYKTNQVLYSVNENTASATASTMKLLTAAAALQVLGPDYKITTKVVQDPADPTVIYIVGGGDVTLSATDAGKQSVYANAPKLITLADDAAAALGDTQITKIVADSSLFPNPQWLASWERSEQTQGYMSQVSALQVDGDRKKAGSETSPRSTAPETRAAKSFKAKLGAIAENATISLGKAPANATLLASVDSQPISTWIPHMLKQSDNTQAEALARLVALKFKLPGDFASIDVAYKRVFNELGLDTSDIHVMDGSGLSDYNAVSPAFMVELMKKIVSKEGDFDIIKKNLAVAGQSGTLSARFTGKNAVARGKVFAKSGWIKHGYTLAGYLKAKDGSTQVFAVYALGKVDDSAKQAIDNLVTGFYKCGAKLSND